MYENEYMYAIERDPEYLAHYGIKGMKWGVRKAIERGNQRALGRQYRKAQKKLAKLEKRAANGAKYARRAARLGAGAAAAGGLAVAGTEGVSRFMKNNAKYAGHATRGVGGAMVRGGQLASKLTRGKVGGKAIQAGYTLQSRGNAAANSVYNAGTGLSSWGRKIGIQSAAGKKLEAAGMKYAAAGGSKAYRATARGAKMRTIGYEMANKGKNMGYTNNQIARVGAAAVGAGLAGAAGYNAYRAATTKRAAKKAAQFRSEMNKAFKGTQYANGGGNRQGKKRRRRG